MQTKASRARSEISARKIPAQDPATSQSSVAASGASPDEAPNQLTADSQLSSGREKWRSRMSEFCGSPNTFLVDSSQGEHETVSLAKALDLITLSPSSVIGGNSLKVILRLPGSSGRKGGKVELTSGNPSVVPLPASVEVAP